MQITKVDKRFFNNFFKDIFNNYKMPSPMVSELIS